MGVHGWECSYKTTIKTETKNKNYMINYLIHKKKTNLLKHKTKNLSIKEIGFFISLVGDRDDFADR